MQYLLYLLNPIILFATVGLIGGFALAVFGLRAPERASAVVMILFGLILCLPAVYVYVWGCGGPDVITEDKLAFLDGQKKPLLTKDLTKLLGDPELRIDHGPYYPYKVRDSDRALRFWMAPPPDPPPSPYPKDGIPSEIAMVTDHRGDDPAVIIWPPELRGKDVREVMKSLYPGTF